MSLILNEEQQMLQEAARDFLAASAPVSRLRDLRDRRDPLGFDPELWRAMAEMGWPAILVPESCGGLGYGHVGMGIVARECGRVLASSPLLSTAVTAVAAFAGCGENSAAREWLERIATGHAIVALACDEQARHQPDSPALAATAETGGWLLDGQKLGVFDGHAADAVLVSARLDDATALFLVPADCTGLKREKQALLDTHGAARLDFDAVRLGPESLLARDGAGVLAAALDAGRVAAAAELLGIAEEVFQRTLDYIRERRQFGVPVGSFQALQHRAAMLFGEIELCKSVVLKAGQALDEQHARSAEFASLAKARAGGTARLATAESIQMHGGIGMTDDIDLGFFIKRYMALEQFLGDTAFHTDRFARLKGY